MMKRKIIACDVFKPYLEYLNASTTHGDIDYLEIKQHNHPDQLAKKIQAKIDLIKDVDEILLLYGLCGNAILPLRARSIPIRVLRVHDCGAVLLGSNEAYRRRFEGNPLKRYHCLSYGDNQEEYFARTSPEYKRIADDYGEDNADYVFKMLYQKNTKPVTYIKLGLPGEDEQIAKQDKDYYSVIDGNLDMLIKMLNGDDEAVQVTLHPGEHFVGVYDYVTILKTENNETNN